MVHAITEPFKLTTFFSQHHQNTILVLAVISYLGLVKPFHEEDDDDDDLIKCIILFNFWRCKTYEQLKLLLELIKYIKQTQTYICIAVQKTALRDLDFAKMSMTSLKSLLPSPWAPWSCGSLSRCLTGLHYGPPMHRHSYSIITCIPETRILFNTCNNAHVTKIAKYVLHQASYVLFVEHNHVLKQ